MSPITDQYDIIVVGAGPAGALTARTAAENGAKVLILEEHEQAGTPVFCAEGLSHKGFIDSGLEPVEPLIAQKIHKVKVFVPSGKSVAITHKEIEGYSLNREHYDKALADSAEAAGAVMMNYTKALGVIKEDGVVVGVKAISDGEEFEIRAPLTVGADGHASIIRRSAGLTRYFSDYGVTAQWTITDLDLEEPGASEIIIGSVVPGAYVWVFPKGKTVANVGLGIRTDRSRPAIQVLEDYINCDPRFKDKPRERKTGGICPSTGTLDKIVIDGMILVGDSAGMVIPLSGAGIHTAIVAGKIAGKVAAEAVAEGNVSAERLLEYHRQFDAAWGKNLRDSKKMLTLADKLTDAEMNKVADMIRQEDILDLVNGRNVIRTIIGIALRDPLFSLKFLTKLL
ncbi:NAD(P)/FAD-dependent oxidoreductase [Candidatus Bathyarchaeota archaeon]|jgi:digeranylgeranylglycerophospholipid reductase|nr:NAD(P)/FAD-dependent oxidoreductase [Candidatus Bathyarchaeota archaeon]